MSAPSKEELIILEKFREGIADIELNDRQKTDMALLAWLRARDMNIPKATEMFKKSIEWKKTEDIKNILLWTPPEEYQKKFPYEICGQNINGCPIIVIPFGKWDVRKIVEAREKHIWLRHIDLMFARVLENMNETNDSRELEGNINEGLVPVTQIILIVDFENYRFDQLTSVSSLQTIKESVIRFEGNYPEIVKTIYLINVPRAFSLLFSILRPLASAKTLEKVQAFMSNPIKWQPELLKYISPDQLPVPLGGTNPNSCKFLSKEYWSISNFESQINKTNDKSIHNISISARKELKLVYDITNENTIITWSFKTDSYDVGFSIIHNLKDEILPYKRYNSNISKQEGSLICEKLGTYSFIFDNKYSKFRAKNLQYTVCVNVTDNELKEN